jgi:Fe-S cluster assembly ATP-binding protein
MEIKTLNKKAKEKVMLEIKNLHVSVDGNEILKGIDLSVQPGEIHAIMGPNGSGKSTLSHVIAGRDGYEITGGRIVFQGEDLSGMEPEERAAKGIFLAFQYPVEIPGVANTTFMKEALNAIRRYHGEDELDAMQFVKIMRQKTKELGISDDMLKRAVNVGFSGGEKKRNEILQMAILNPTLAVLDETDSGLDIDALKIVAEGVNKMRSPERSILLITHYQRLLDYIVPDRVHVLAHGRIQRTGGKELALELEEKGYAEFGEAVA